MLYVTSQQNKAHHRQHNGQQGQMLMVMQRNVQLVAPPHVKWVKFIKRYDNAYFLYKPYVNHKIIFVESLN